MDQQTVSTESIVNDGRIRVENFEFMQSQPPRRFNWLRIDSNDNCNLKCTYCRIPRSSGLIDAVELERFLREKVLGVNNLQFGCGMEPSIDKRLSDLLLMAATTPAKPTNRFVLQTNGTKLHKHDHEKIAQCGLTRLSVSIDSLDEEVHGFQRGGSSVNQIMENLKSFRKNCPAIEIQFVVVVTKQSIASCEALAEFAIELGVTRVAFREMVHVADDTVADPVKVAPLIVPAGEFTALTERLQGKYLNRGTDFAFLPIAQLHQNRLEMRKHVFPADRDGSWQRKRLDLPPTDNCIRNADKPMLTPLKQPDEDTDLLAGKKFFVIRGFMKSGTNWIGRLLNLHPEISCAGEFHWQYVTEPFIRNIDRSKLLREKDGLRHEMWMRLDRMMKECMVMANHPDATWVGDRTPVHIAPTVITDSKIINLIRDGRDVLVSRAHHFFNHPTSIPELARMPDNQQRHQAFQADPEYFLNHPNQLLACEQFVRLTAQAWVQTIEANESAVQELSPERCLEVRYESVHRDTEAVRREMYEFFEVDPELAGPLAFNTQPGFAQESPNKFLRKGAVGDWKNYVTPEVAAVFDEVAGATLLRLGYVDSSDWH